MDNNCKDCNKIKTVLLTLSKYLPNELVRLIITKYFENHNEIEYWWDDDMDKLDHYINMVYIMDKKPNKINLNYNETYRRGFYYFNLDIKFYKNNKEVLSYKTIHIDIEYLDYEYINNFLNDFIYYENIEVETNNETIFDEDGWIKIHFIMI
jgi:hypothetical protein